MEDSHTLIDRLASVQKLFGLYISNQPLEASGLVGGYAISRLSVWVSITSWELEVPNVPWWICPTYKPLLIVRYLSAMDA